MGNLEAIKSTQKEAIKPPKMWNVVLLNDDFTSFDFVSFCLQNIFGKSVQEAERITMSVHEKGRGIAGQYTKEIAETKQVMTMEFAQAQGQPLKLVLEES